MVSKAATREYARFPKRELRPGQRRLLTIRGREVAAFNADGRLYAVFNRCPHHQAPLLYGTLVETNVDAPVGQLAGRVEHVVQCPWHHYEFALGSGRCLSDPKLRVATYEISEDGDDFVILG